MQIAGYQPYITTKSHFFNEFYPNSSHFPNDLSHVFSHFPKELSPVSSHFPNHPPMFPRWMMPPVVPPKKARRTQIGAFAHVRANNF